MSEGNKGRPVAGLVLAAGASRRMGSATNKLTQIVDGKALIAGPVDAMLEAGIAPVCVVLGHAASEVRAALGDRPCVWIESPDWEEGMGASIAAGVGQIRAGSEVAGVFVCVGDLAGLEAESLGTLLARFSEAESVETICVPTNAGRRGHPVLFGAGYLKALSELSGDSGGRGILEAHPQHVIEVAVESDGIHLDLDTPEDFEAFRRRP